MRMTHFVLKKRVCLLLALVLFLSVVGFSQTEILKVKVKVRRANVREQPSLEGEIIAVVRRGAILQADGKEGEWYLIRLPLKLEGFALPGYIHESVVEVVGEEKPQPKIKAPEKRAERKPRKLGAGLIIGASYPAREAYNSAAYFNAYVSYRFVEEFTLELSAQGFRSGVDNTPGGLSGGDLTIIPIQLSIQRRFPFQGKTFAYFTGGIGYYLINYTLGDSSFSREETVNSTLGFHVGAGLEYMFRENLALKLELKYSFTSTNGSWSYIDPVTGYQEGQFNDVKLDSAVFGIGIKFYF